MSYYILEWARHSGRASALVTWRFHVQTSLLAKLARVRLSRNLPQTPPSVGAFSIGWYAFLMIFCYMLYNIC
jgi:hypothetical protein